MPATLPNVLIPPTAEWVDLYALTGIAVGTAIEVDNIGAADVFLTVAELKPAPDNDSYNILEPNSDIRLRNSSGDPGAWAYAGQWGTKLNIRVL